MIKRLAPALLIPFFVLLFLPLSADAASRSFNITAEQWAFTPSTITVTEGDVVTLDVTSVDVSHGLAISQFGVNIPLSPGVTASATFTANKAGTYSFFCNVACGRGHGSMKGTLIVQAVVVETNTNTSTTTNTNTGTTNTNTTGVNASQPATTNTSTTTTETSTPAANDPVAEAEAVNELELSQDEPRTVNDSTNQSVSTNASTDIIKKTNLPNVNNQLNVAVADASADEPNGSSSALGIGLIVVGVVVFGGVIFFVVKKKSNN